jgi:hypothetical protein
MWRLAPIRGTAAIKNATVPSDLEVADGTIQTTKRMHNGCDDDVCADVWQWSDFDPN